MTDPVPSSAASADKEKLFGAKPPALEHPLNPPKAQIAIDHVMAHETGKPLPVPANPPANDPGSAALASDASAAPAYALLPRGEHADWRLGARLIAEGKRLDEVARDLRVTRRKIVRNLRNSDRFREMIEEERLVRHEADTLRFRGLRSDVIDQIAEAVRAGDRRLLLWAAGQLSPGLGWPPRQIAEQVEFNRTYPIDRRREQDSLKEDGGDIPDVAADG